MFTTTKIMATTTKRPKTKPSLADIAANMRAIVDQGGARWTHHRLAGGLEIVLDRRNGREWRLAIARPLVQPSAHELDICRRAFHVPDVIEGALVQKQRPSRSAQLPATPLYVAEYRWLE